jgi:hypothetical protein
LDGKLNKQVNITKVRWRLGEVKTRLDLG